MTTLQQIKSFIGALPSQKAAEMEQLFKQTKTIAPKARLWFSDGKNSDGKVVANPTIGFGNHTLQYANGTTAETFKVGLSANTTGISVYIMGVKDKTFLAKNYGKKIGKASVTGYCIKFKSVKDISVEVLGEAIAAALN